MRGPARNAGTIWFTGADMTTRGIWTGRTWAADNRQCPHRQTETEKRPEAWLMRVEETGTGLTVEEKLTSGEAADEYLLMGLRLAEGNRSRALQRAVRPQSGCQACLDHNE